MLWTGKQYILFHLIYCVVTSVTQKYIANLCVTFFGGINVIYFILVACSMLYSEENSGGIW